MSTLEYSHDFNQTNQETYEIISKEFSETRAYVWKCIKDFTELIKIKNENIPTILEIGCGNGKNMHYLLNNISCNLIGIDTCQNFIDLCISSKLNVKKNNITNLDFNDNTFDYILCIATFHHLLSDTDKNKGMKEIIRVMKSGAIGIITCWSTEQPEDSKFNFHDGINIVMWKGRQDLNKTRYYYVYNYTMFLEFFTSFVEIEIIKIYNEVGNWILLFKKK
jgi:ubiquinone/menaquinone biosynthesis C-methylase UbiE